MEYLAILVDLKNRPVLVVGGGVVAARKVRMLKCAGAKIKLVADMLCCELLSLVNDNKIQWIDKKFNSLMLDGIFLVIVATDNKELNTLVYCNANKRHILVNVVDDQLKCSFIFPSIINRNPIIVAISSCGKAPVLTRILREKLEALLPNFLGIMASLAGSWRSVVKKHILNIVERRKFWENVFCSAFADLIAKGRLKEANTFLSQSLDSKSFVQSGSIALVGAGPGDSGLLTLRGLQLIQQADVVLYDDLVSQDVLSMVRRDAQCICVGKRVNNNSISQNTINDLLVKLANEGNRVVRLKGGDPLIFGRGGEELQRIIESGISFQIVPGITAASGAAACTGIPLTHRKYSHSIVFISGHLCCNDYDKLNWKMLSCKYQTLVIYMGIMNASKIGSLLINHGRDLKTPVAIISRATYRDQKILVVQLEQLQHFSQYVVLPALLIIGEVVSFYVKTNLFSQQDFNIYEFNSVIKLY
ncbi:siroheme synthase CysG [Blochmannia endosymbiont of Camponotus (Colobopsis) obliquus]|uniref:siroheme synthase CysG n=1 Tax=Blochmannia endosymbiont of Camponotus (Colobopsis) obliquus TaxID=1505597 RepID=UPI00061A9E51|nr:siroheme synthase CysG [Blochmannia endosymbiont of Camponotus (Colobopsis) obliquus]